MSLPSTLIIALVAVVFLYQSLRIANEDERFAIFILGKFAGFRGPGLVFVAPFTQRIVRIKVGATGQVKGSGLVAFGEHDIPVASASSFSNGQSVRIDRFDGTEPVLVESSVQASRICPNCGHQFD